MKNFHINNIQKGIITTVLGGIIIIIGILFMFSKGHTITEGIALILFGLALLGIKDPRMPNGVNSGKVATFLLAIAIFTFLLFSCASFDKCAQKYGTGDSVIVHHTDSVLISETVISNADSLALRFQLDSLLSASVTDTFYIESKAGKAKAKFWKDRYNNYLLAQIDCPEDTVFVEKKVLIEVDVPCPEAVVLDETKHMKWHQKVWRGFKEFSAYVLLGLIAFMVIKRIIG